MGCSGSKESQVEGNGVNPSTEAPKTEDIEYIGQHVSIKAVQDSPDEEDEVSPSPVSICEILVGHHK